MSHSAPWSLYPSVFKDLSHNNLLYNSTKHSHFNVVFIGGRPRLSNLSLGLIQTNVVLLNPHHIVFPLTPTSPRAFSPWTSLFCGLPTRHTNGLHNFRTPSPCR